MNVNELSKCIGKKVSVYYEGGYIDTGILFKIELADSMFDNVMVGLTLKNVVKEDLNMNVTMFSDENLAIMHENEINSRVTVLG